MSFGKLPNPMSRGVVPMRINMLVSRGGRRWGKRKLNGYWLQNISVGTEENCPRSIGLSPRQGVNLIHKWQKNVMEIK